MIIRVAARCLSMGSTQETATARRFELAKGNLNIPLFRSCIMIHVCNHGRVSAAKSA